MSEETRGGGEYPVYGLTNREALRRKIKFRDAAARKRLLQARYMSWARESSRMPNLIGKGGERATHASLKNASLQVSPRVRCMLEKDEGGDVRRLFGQEVPSGPLDNAAHFMIRGTDGIPQLVTAVIEVKNLRHWIYPDTPELFQLLDKAMRLQIVHPDRLIVPVLICRQRQYLTHTMAQDLGCFVVPMVNQPMLPHVEVSDEHFNEVCNELGYNLVRTDGALDRLVTFFQEELPKYAIYNAKKWQQTAAALNTIARALQTLRQSNVSWNARSLCMRSLKLTAVRVLGANREWIGDISETEEP